MSRKFYDYPFFDLSKPFTIDGENVKVKVQVAYDFTDDDITTAKYVGISWNLHNADDETQPVKLTVNQWERIDGLIYLLNGLYETIEVVACKEYGLTTIKHYVADNVKTTTFGNMFDAVTKDPKCYDELKNKLVKALQLSNHERRKRNKSASFTGRRDTSDDGLTFGDICKDMIWPFL